jgi:peptidoglycan/LPS O-acetylase OafA/YrhL
MFFLFLQNFSLGWYGDWNWITVTMAWSLALEEQFYLTLPLAVKRLDTKTLVRMTTLLVLGAPVLRFFVPNTPHAIGSLLHQALFGDGLVAGFLCAALVRSHFKPRSICLGTTVLVLAPLVVITHVTSSPVEFLRETSLAAFYSCILLLAVRGSFAVLRSFVLRFFGTISYTLYLVHQSALVYLHHIVRHQQPSNLGGKATFVSIAALLISIAAAWFSWVLLEKPLLSWARRKFRY